jgi:hypothetical protein
MDLIQYFRVTSIRPRALVFTGLFYHLGSKFWANVPLMSHFEQICFFAKTGAIVKWE